MILWSFWQLAVVTRDLLHPESVDGLSLRVRQFSKHLTMFPITFWIISKLGFSLYITLQFPDTMFLLVITLVIIYIYRDSPCTF